MRFCFVIIFCLFLAVVNSAAVKAPKKQSAFDYLRSIRGKNSCANGTCPFWERHGRSFVSFQCFAQAYQDCVCLHRMCYSSCLFNRQLCNQGMVQCLQQICLRCSPTPSLALYTVSNALVTSITNALSTFACYSCCAVRGNPLNNTLTIAAPANNRVPQSVNTAASGSGRPSNGNTGSVNGGNRPANGNTGSANGANRPANGNTGSVNSGARPASGNTANRPANGNTVNRPASGNTVNRPVSGNTGNRPANGNTGSVNSANRPVNGNTGSVNGANRPANGNTGSANGANRPANSGNNGLKKPSNVNQGSANKNNGASVNQRVQKQKSTTKRTQIKN